MPSGRSSNAIESLNAPTLLGWTSREMSAGPASPVSESSAERLIVTTAGTVACVALAHDAPGVDRVRPPEHRAVGVEGVPEPDALVDLVAVAAALALGIAGFAGGDERGTVAGVDRDEGDARLRAASRSGPA